MKSLDEIIESQTLVGNGYVTTAGAKVIAEQYTEQLIPKWISVKDRLPLINSDVLVSDGLKVKCAWFGKRPIKDDADFRFASMLVTHWMPLPDEPT